MLSDDLKTFLASKADDMKAEDIVTIDVVGKSSVTDYMIVCTGSSKLHVSSIANNMESEANSIGLSSLGIDGEKEGEWVVLDMGDVMVHVMQKEHRELYQLEKLWS
ncbi:ribosome silencing factor [Vibrio sp. F74]|uniref:ribosome silencing factor n=1 Tax=Vibrio sp. F74 TaxID=700020 RepID=UPI0035F565F3